MRELPTQAKPCARSRSAASDGLVTTDLAEDRQFFLFSVACKSINYLEKTTFDYRDHAQ